MSKKNFQIHLSTDSNMTKKIKKVYQIKKLIIIIINYYIQFLISFETKSKNIILYYFFLTFLFIYFFLKKK